MSVHGEDTRASDSPLPVARPFFFPPPEMRRGYLDRRRRELEALVNSARDNEWKYVVAIVHSVRGTGSMFGFPNVSETAESLCRAIQNAEPKCIDYVNRYVKAVNESYV